MAVKTYEVKIPVCRGCNFVVDLGMCSDACEHDADERTKVNTVYHVYRRTDEYLRDEDYE